MKAKATERSESAELPTDTQEPAEWVPTLEYAEPYAPPPSPPSEPMLSGVTPGLLTAVCCVMAELQTISHDAKNLYDGYAYASIDAYMAAIRPACAKHGLVIIQDLEHQQVASGQLSSQWRFFVLHAGSLGTMGPIRFDSMASASMGAQAAGGAQAYGLKFFLRSLFMVAADAADDVDKSKATKLQDGPTRAPAQRRDEGPPARIPSRTRGEKPAIPKAEGAFASPLDKLKARIASIPGANLGRCAAYFGLNSVDEFTEKQIIESGEVLDRFEAARAEQDEGVGI